MELVIEVGALTQQNSPVRRIAPIINATGPHTFEARGHIYGFDSAVCQIANVGRRDAHTRIAHLLCEFSLRLRVAGLGEATNYELPMTQEHIADCTGLTPIRVNRMLKQLETDNLISRRGSRSVTIGDWIKLADAGGFNSNYLHLR